MLQMRIIGSPNFIQVKVKAVRNWPLSGRKCFPRLLSSSSRLFSNPAHPVIEADTWSDTSQSSTAYTTYYSIMLFNVNNWLAFFLQNLSNIFLMLLYVRLAVSQLIVHLSVSPESCYCSCCVPDIAMLTLTLQRTVLYWVPPQPACCTNLHSEV